MNSLTSTFKMNNGVEIPCIGLGTWQTPDGETAISAVKAAVKAGYRHIDCAACYKNEVSVGEGIAQCGIPREELFITSKVWNSERGKEKTIAACEKTLEDLGLDYLDLYLIHWPASFKDYENWEEINVSTWEGMIELYKNGKVKAIGVSNFMPHHLKALMNSEIIPMINQIEFHPGQMEEETVKFCREHNIVVEAYSPLGTGKMLNNETLKTIADKYNKSVAQLCIKWVLQNEVLPLPKSINEVRIIENADVFDFEISKEDMNTINSMEYFAGSNHHPDKVRF